MLKPEKIAMLALCLTLVLLLCACGASAPAERVAQPHSSGENAPSARETAASAGIAGSGTEEDPWLVGSGDPGDVQAFLVDTALIITGSGRMMDFSDEALRPWNEAIGSVEQVSIFDEVTYIGENAFKDAGSRVDWLDIFLAETLNGIGKSAFEGANLSMSYLTIPEAVTEIGSRAFADCGVSNIDMGGIPAIEEDAFAGVDADVNYRSCSGWTEDTLQPYGGTLRYHQLFAFSYEQDFSTEKMSGECTMYIPEGEEYTYNAVDDLFEDGYHFVRFEVIEGDITIENPENPELTFTVTGDVKIRILFAPDKA